MQYAIYLDIDLFTFLRCVSSRRPLEEIPLKATKDSCQKSLETTLGSDLVPSNARLNIRRTRSLDWMTSYRRRGVFLVQIRDVTVLANQNDQSKKCLFETNLDARPVFFHERCRTRPRPRSVELKHRNTRKCNYKRKQITRIFFFKLWLTKDHRYFLKT